jgi:hypothetical protein
MRMSSKSVFNNFVSEHRSDISKRLLWRKLKDTFDFKFDFLKIYALLELNCQTLYNRIYYIFPPYNASGIPLGVLLPAVQNWCSIQTCFDTFAFWLLHTLRRDVQHLFSGRLSGSQTSSGNEDEDIIPIHLPGIKPKYVAHRMSMYALRDRDLYWISLVDYEITNPRQMVALSIRIIDSLIPQQNASTPQESMEEAIFN